MALYRQVAGQIQAQIREGHHGPGARLPGVRRLAHQFGVSVSTMVSALQALEDLGWVEARPRSGFFVRPGPGEGPELPASRPPAEPRVVTSQAITLDMIRSSGRPDLLQFATAVPDADFFPLTAVRRALRQAERWRRGDVMDYAFPPGIAALREQVARRLADGGVVVAPDRVLITSGTQEATNLALRAVTRPGDVVAVESPTYYGLLQVLESLGLEALEIPTDPRTGISLPALELALQRWPVKAVALVPSFSNPTGYLMPRDAKRGLAELVDRYRVPLIEDDIYADLGSEDASSLRPLAVKAFDAADRVFLCGSASKTVAPGLRVGWIVAPDGARERLEYLKYTGSLSAPTLSQYALAELYGQVGIDRHLRRVRDRYAELTTRMAQRVLAAFPDGTAVSRPAGGFVIWVQMPATIDSVRLWQQARREGIGIAPGTVFSASGRYEQFIRLNAAVRPSADVERALVRLGVLAAGQR